MGRYPYCPIHFLFIIIQYGKIAITGHYIDPFFQQVFPDEFRFLSFHVEGDQCAYIQLQVVVDCHRAIETKDTSGSCNGLQSQNKPLSMDSNCLVILTTIVKIILVNDKIIFFQILNLPYHCQYNRKANPENCFVVTLYY